MRSTSLLTGFTVVVFAAACSTWPAMGQFDDVSNWAAFDAGEHGVGVDPDGYDGIVFDGRYVYFSPGFNGTEHHGEVLRYDTEGDFDHAPSWTAYDPGAHGVGLIARGYRGLAFDGRYIYFAPFAYSAGTVHGEVLRCDTTGEFSDLSSWAAYNPSSHDIGYNATGYNDAVFDGRYVYFVPFYNSTGTHGEVLRYDTLATFDTPSAWNAYDPGANDVGNTPDGYKSAVFDGRYVYFAPSHTSAGYHGEVLRYDTERDFSEAPSWATYDPGEHDVGMDPGGFATIVFDGRYVYFGPGFGANGEREALRYDTTADFFTPSSWVTFDPQSQGLGTWETSFAGVVFDGRYILFTPHTDFDISTEVILRYDTAASFIDPLSWSVFDPASAGVGTGIDGHHTGVFDGRYVYFAPTNWNYPELMHGEVLRYDTGAPESIPTVSEWGLVVMALLLLSVGTLVLQRRCYLVVHAGERKSC
ncbi:MAG: IPTL-CTERM sorting domain-containing protein [Phycisphaerales bacterium]|nr:MAG: IPTL-CTERM sorting domain-containing protein [Phycisphaerales bacterium]